MMKNRVLLMAAVLSVGMCFPMSVSASSYMAGEALVEEESEQNAVSNTGSSTTNNATDNTGSTRNNATDNTDSSTTNNAIDNTKTNTVNNTTSEAVENSEQADTTKSSNADLKKLDIQPGTLTPEFSADVTDYTFVLEDNNMNQVLLTTKTKSKKAEVIAVSGFTNLKIGDNLAVLTVKAEDGTTKSYHVTITRNQGEVEAETVSPAAELSTEGYIQAGQDDLVVHKDFADELIPEGCVKVEYSYKGHYVDAAYFEEGELILLYASGADGSDANFYVYYSGSDEYFEFVPFESSNGLLVFPVQYPTGIPIPNYFVESSIDFNGTVIAGYTVSESLFEEEEEYTDMEIEEEEPTYILPETTEYFLFFGISSNGNKGWYLYDMIENTCQRYLDLTTDVQENVFDEESYVVYKEKSQQRMVAICVLLFIVLIFIGITLNQFLKIRELKSELPDDDDDDDDPDDDGGDDEGDEDEDEEDDDKATRKEKTKRAKGRGFFAKRAAKDSEELEETQEAKNQQAQTQQAKPEPKKPAKKVPKQPAKPAGQQQAQPTRQQQQAKPVAKSTAQPAQPTPRKPAQPAAKPEQQVIPQSVVQSPQPVVQSPQPAAKPAPVKKPQLPPDLDDDFEFEFIDISR